VTQAAEADLAQQQAVYDDVFAGCMAAKGYTMQ
jgi:hypothetical protein